MVLKQHTVQLTQSSGALTILTATSACVIPTCEWLVRQLNPLADDVLGVDGIRIRVTLRGEGQIELPKGDLMIIIIVHLLEILLQLDLQCSARVNRHMHRYTCETSCLECSVAHRSRTLSATTPYFSSACLNSDMEILPDLSVSRSLKTRSSYHTKQVKIEQRAMYHQHPVADDACIPTQRCQAHADIPVNQAQLLTCSHVLFRNS